MNPELLQMLLGQMSGQGGQSMPGMSIPGLPPGFMEMLQGSQTDPRNSPAFQGAAQMLKQGQQTPGAGGGGNPLGGGFAGMLGQGGFGSGGFGDFLKGNLQKAFPLVPGGQLGAPLGGAFGQKGIGSA